MWSHCQFGSKNLELNSILFLLGSFQFITTPRRQQAHFVALSSTAPLQTLHSRPSWRALNGKHESRLRRKQLEKARKLNNITHKKKIIGTCIGSRNGKLLELPHSDAKLPQQCEPQTEKGNFRDENGQTKDSSNLTLVGVLRKSNKNHKENGGSKLKHSDQNKLLCCLLDEFRISCTHSFHCDQNTDSTEHTEEQHGKNDRCNQCLEKKRS